MADKIKAIGRKGYTILQNDMITDWRLSLKTKGLAAVIFSRPDDWEFTVGGLAAYCGCGRDAVRSALAELEAAGYLTRKQLHGEGGVFAGNLYELHEGSNATAADDQEAATPSLENPTTVEQSSSGKPSADKPSTGNPTERNTDIKNYGSKEPPYNPPEGGGMTSASKPKRRVKTEPTYRPDWFARFWALYPRRQKRIAAVRAWDKLRPDLPLCKTMASAIRAQMQTPQWREGTDHIPHPSTWLNGARWLDEVGPADKPQETEVVPNGWR